MASFRWSVPQQDHQPFAPFGIDGTAMLSSLRDKPNRSGPSMQRSAPHVSDVPLPCRNPAP